MISRIDIDDMSPEPADMSDKTDLTAAIALIRKCGFASEDGAFVYKKNRGVPEQDFWVAVATVLNAVVSGDLVPAGRPAIVAGGNGAAVRGW